MIQFIFILSIVLILLGFLVNLLGTMALLAGQLLSYGLILLFSALLAFYLRNRQ